MEDNTFWDSLSQCCYRTKESARGCCSRMNKEASALVRGNPEDGKGNDAVKDDESWREKDNPDGLKVELNIYDVQSRLAKFNKALTKQFHAGAYHGGVVVYLKDIGPKEFSFGGCDEGSGIFTVEPKQATQFKYEKTIEMGHTPLSTDKVIDILERMESEWPGKSYSLIKRNCCHFSEAFCEELGVPRPFPSWVNRLAKTGAKIDHDIDRVMHKAYATGKKINRSFSAFGKSLKRMAKKSSNKLFHRKPENASVGTDSETDIPSPDTGTAGGDVVAEKEEPSPPTDSPETATKIGNDPTTPKGESAPESTTAEIPDEREETAEPPKPPTELPEEGM